MQVKMYIETYDLAFFALPLLTSQLWKAPGTFQEAIQLEWMTKV